MIVFYIVTLKLFKWVGVDTAKIAHLVWDPNSKDWYPLKYFLKIEYNIAFI